jgi:hypothetical protein
VEHTVEVVDLNGEEVDEIDQMINSPEKRLEYVNKLLKTGEEQAHTNQVVVENSNQDGITQQTTSQLVLNISPSKTEH